MTWTAFAILAMFLLKWPIAMRHLYTMFGYQFLVCAVLVYALSIYDLIWLDREKIYDLHQTKLACSMGRVPLLVKMRGITCIRVPTWKSGIQCKINNVGEVILNLYNSQNLEYVQWSEGEYWIYFIRRNEFNIYNIRMYVLNIYNI